MGVQRLPDHFVAAVVVFLCAKRSPDKEVKLLTNPRFEALRKLASCPK